MLDGQNHPLRRCRLRRDIKCRTIRQRPHAHRPTVQQCLQSGHRGIAKATETATMDHDPREPARTFNMVTDVTLDLLASTRKLSDARYFSIFDEEEIQMYDARTTKVATSKPPVLKWWRDKVSTLWRIPLVKRAPGPDDGHVISRSSGTRATNWDVKNPTHLFPPPPAKPPKTSTN